MAERKATNKYYPPEWDPKMGSINTFRNSHPLRERARKLKTEGVLVVRFEMPYNVWCTSCNAHIGKGVRYNAEKKKIGMYYTSPIFQFRMKCAECGGMQEVHTDPQNHDFKFVSGVRRTAESTESAAERAVVRVASEDEAKRLVTDPMYRLEHQVDDANTRKAEAPRLAELVEVSHTEMDYYDANALLRKQMREKKALERAAEEAKKLPSKNAIEAFGAPVLEETEADRAAAARVAFARETRDVDLQQRAKRRLEIEHESPFGGSLRSSSLSHGSGNTVLSKKVKALATALPSGGASQELVGQAPQRLSLVSRLSAEALRRELDSGGRSISVIRPPR